ncbi:hypothetical protein RB195_002544 [Necator americanus]|uniref:Uncharacterized protein n=1 Tax=Necator americanus TaxID=51031 RepID=A0ABR1DKA6_NECAM
MADSCQRRSRSLGSAQGSRSRNSVPYSQRTNNNVDPRCTCPHPPGYCPPHGRASIRTTRPVRHPSFASHYVNKPPVIYEFPLSPSRVTSYSSRPSLPHFHPAPRYPPFHNCCGRFPEPPRRRVPSAPPAPFPSTSYRHGHYNAGINYAKTVHPSCEGRTSENAIRHVYYLRAYPRRFSRLFVAEYQYLERLRRYPTILADWTLPSFQPYYSVVYLRSHLPSSVCCDSFRNVCVATIGGRGGGKAHPKQSTHLCYYSRLSDEGNFSSGCRAIYGDKEGKDLYKPCKNSPPTTRSCTSFSETLEVDSDVYDTGTRRRSSSSYVTRRKPYTPERSTQSYASTRSCCTNCRSSSTSTTTRRSSSTPSVVRWVTQERKRPVCPRHGSTTSSSGATTKSRGSSSSSVSREREAARELQDLENFLGLKTTRINKPSDQTHDSGCRSCRSSSCSGVSTANPICECSGCIKMKRSGTAERLCCSCSTASATSLVAGTSIIAGSRSTSPSCVHELGQESPICSSCSRSMVSVPSVSGSTARVINDPNSPSLVDYVSATSQPNGSFDMTVSGPREDSRSGGREIRRPPLRSVCDFLPEHDCGNISHSTSTAYPIHDPNCRQCAEARFADRLSETLHESCSCTPVIRTEPNGTISLIHTSAPTRKDTVMNERNKKSLLDHISKTNKEAKTMREAVMQWVQKKAAVCKSRLNKRRK